VIIERQVDCGEVYGAQRRVLLNLVASATASERALRVPATPDWSVQDVVAHLVGIAADLNAQRFDADDPDAWTARQVANRRGRSIAALATEWEGESPQFEDGLRLLGYEMGSHFVGDLLQHAQDVRSALGRQRPPDDEALAVGLDHYLNTLHQALMDAGAGSLAVTVGDEAWVLGAGPKVTTLAAERFELFRALGGRRSIDQLQALGWSAPPGPLLQLLSPYPLPTTDLADP
jgi:uncharacterized protein (TIGR03083 family)